MTPVYVDHFGYQLGEVRQSVEEAVAAGRTRSSLAALRDAGFRHHQTCGPATSAYRLAEAAVARIEPHLGAIGAIVYATCIPANGTADPGVASADVKDLMDFPASRLQARFGLDRAFVVGLNQQACTGMLGSLRLARALITAEPGIDRALCVTADRFPPGASYEQAYNLISDGAAACVVSRQPGRYRILAAAHVTNGAMVGAGDDETVGAYFTYTHRVVTAALDQAGVKAAELRWVVPQNTNPKAWLILARLLGLGPSTVVHAPTLADAAHVISADNVVNLAHLEASGAPRPGDTLLLTMAGFGMNWQALVLERQ